MEYSLSFILNQRPQTVKVDAQETLLHVLREKLLIKSPKRGCETGDCGACTVLQDGLPIRSCITLAMTVEGTHITTVEGLSHGGVLHPIQKAFHELGASQCGYCTPAMILAIESLLRRCPDPQRMEIREALGGNLCRCTGYTKIIDATQMAAREIAAQKTQTGS